MEIKELSLSETIQDLERQVQRAKDQLQQDPDEVLRDFLDARILHTTNIVRWLKDYKRLCDIASDDRK